MITEYKQKLERLYLAQKSHEWLAARKNFISASDVPKLLAFKEKKPFYKEKPIEWFNQKIGVDEYNIDAFSKDIMRKGEMSETVLVNKFFSDKKFGKGLVVTFNRFICSLDILNSETWAPIELKHTENKSIYDQYVNKTHHAYFQLAFQMWVLNKSEKHKCTTGHLICCFMDKTIPDVKPVVTEFTIDTNSIFYKTIEENIHWFEEIHKSVMLKKLSVFNALFHENTSQKKIEDENIPIKNKQLIEGDPNSDLQRYFYAHRDADRKIKDLKELQLKYEEEIKNILGLNKQVVLNSDEKNDDSKYVVFFEKAESKSKKLKPHINASDVFDVSISICEKMRVKKYNNR